MNRFDIIGRIGSDVVARTNDNTGKPYCFVSVCVNTRTGTTEDGRALIRADWFDIAVNNPHLVDLMSKYGTKGKQVRVTGDMRIKKHGTGNNTIRETLYGVGYSGDIELLGSPSNDAGTASSEGDQAEPQSGPDLPPSDA